MKKRVSTISEQLQIFEEEILRLEGRILELEQKLERMISIERNHLVRLKNKEDLTDDFIQNGKTYQDLSPEKAWDLYQNRDFNFVMIDVSSEDYKPLMKIPEAVQMPWEDFKDRSLDITTKTTPILIISEDGTNSILACEFLVKRGFMNCNNVSGGYKHWRGFKLKQESA